MSRCAVSVIVMCLLTGCTSVPSGPSVLVLPGARKDFVSFTHDDGFCRQYALVQIGGTPPSSSAAQTGVGAAAVGTALGAASGAAFGGGYGATVGAGAGLIGGSLIGSGMGYQAGYAMQQRYDHAYMQCMYGHGHQVPIQGVIAQPTSGNVSGNTAPDAQNGVPLPPTETGLTLPPNHTGTPSTKERSQGSLPLPPTP